MLELTGLLTVAGDALARVEAAAARVFALVRTADPVTEPRRPVPLPAHRDISRQGVALEGVALAWPDSNVVVAGVDFRLDGGQRAVVTGPSGAGKSTLAAALVRFLDPVTGAYSVGGVPAADLGGDEVRRAVTWCEQNPWFADTTIADNLRIARPAATDEQLWEALGVVHLDGWARRLPDGLETRLERDAGAMSGGERQRLALARALLGGQQVIVLDEPTAHLDDATAHAVLADLLTATADRAVVVIAHGDTARGIGPEYRIEPTADGPSTWRSVRGTRWWPGPASIR